MYLFRILKYVNKGNMSAQRITQQGKTLQLLIDDKLLNKPCQAFCNGFDQGHLINGHQRYDDTVIGLESFDHCFSIDESPEKAMQHQQHLALTFLTVAKDRKRFEWRTIVVFRIHLVGADVLKKKK